METPGIKIKILTTFQLPIEIKDEVKIFSKRSHTTVSGLLTEGLEELLAGNPGDIPALEKGTEKLKYTSVLLPQDIRDQAKALAFKNKVSFGDVSRHALKKVLEASGKSIRSEGE